MPKDMLGRGEAVSADEALERLLALPVSELQSEEIPIEKAYSRILSSGIVSSEDMPGFRRSTMDGYAVKASDTFGCSETVPAYLKLSGEVRMGENTDANVCDGEAVSIPTGGMVPEGADAVVMFEQVQKSSDDMIEVLKSVAPGENIVQAGEDVKKGSSILNRHHLLRPQDIAALAGLGVILVNVFKKPLVGIVSTGDEIIPPDKLPKPGQVKDINSYNLAGLINDTGGVPKKYGIYPDKYDVLNDIIKKAIDECDMVLVSGGSSVGTRDMTADIINALEENGVLFHGVAVKPGKPLIGGYVKGTPVFGLPGHPAAVTVSFLNFVEPVLKKIAGIKVQYKKDLVHTVEAQLTKNLSSAPGREDHIRVALVEKDGVLFAEPVLGKSGLISTLVKADGIVTVPDKSQGMGRGETVKVRVFKKW